jgi:hypothetical protein
MSACERRLIWFLIVPVVAGAGVGLFVLWAAHSFAPVRYGPPIQLASVPVAASVLAWAADGAYLAAGRPGGGSRDNSDVFVVNVAKSSVTTTLQVAGWIEGLAFSPDGHWLAVTTGRPFPDGAAPGELVVFDVPAFTTKFTAKTNLGDGFKDIAWAADSKALCVIDDLSLFKQRTGAQPHAAVRRWTVPAFTERPTITAPQVYHYEAIAVSPDGRTLAVADIASEVRLVRLFDLATGAEKPAPPGNPPRLGFIPDRNAVGEPTLHLMDPLCRLGFTPDSKAVGIFDAGKLSWWDASNGHLVKPASARLAVQPAGLNNAHNAISTDGRWRAEGYEERRGLGDLGWDGRDDRFGAFVRLTNPTTAKTWIWRTGDGAIADGPVLAFSLDGTKLAGTVLAPSGASAIVIWAVPN